VSVKTRYRALLITAGLTLSLATGCGRDTPPSNLEAPLGRDMKTDTKVLEKGAEALQNLSPVQSLDFYLDGFHVMKDDLGLHMEAHHFCKGMNEDFTQCVIFDGNTADSNIIGVEYIIAEPLFATLDAEEKKKWHPHNFEILSGQLVMPGVPDVAEKAALKKKLNSYGKTWHIWDTGHAGHPASDKLPVGDPRLAWSYNREGESPPGLVEARDKRMGIDTAAKRKDREDLVPLAKPQQGVDDLKAKLPGSKTEPAGVHQAQ
jgi:Protein of unknown function (DUF1264)